MASSSDNFCKTPIPVSKDGSASYKRFCTDNIIETVIVSSNNETVIQELKFGEQFIFFLTLILISIFSFAFNKISFVTHSFNVSYSFHAFHFYLVHHSSIHLVCIA